MVEAPLLNGQIPHLNVLIAHIAKPQDALFGDTAPAKIVSGQRSCWVNSHARASPAD